MFKYIAIVLLVGFTVGAAPIIPSEVAQYEKLLRESRSTKDKSIEPVFSKGMDAINALSDVLSENESDLDAAWLKGLRQKMEGFYLNPNTETYVASPTPKFFQNLASAHGTTIDVSYFELEAQTFPDGRFPIFIRQETDLGGCTKYDGSLSKLYKSWTSFQSKNPKAYENWVKRYLGQIEESLVETGKPCDGNKVAMLKELSDFVKENPNAPVAAKIKKNLMSLEKSKTPSNN